MTSTPVSLNDESLNGSWIDINSASQIHSPMDDDSPEFLAPPYSLAESVQNLGLISFQVERFLQEAQRNQNSNSQLNLPAQNGDDDNSGIYTSDTDVSADGIGSSQAFIARLRRQQKHDGHRQQQPNQQQQHHHHNNNNASSNESNNNNKPHSNNNQSKNYHPTLNGANGPRLSKSGESLVDQLSDSLSLLSRASAFGEQPTGKQLDCLGEDFDWLWDWTAQPEYFSGQEWKVYAPKQDYLMRQRQLYCANLNRDHNGTRTLFSGEVISLLFLTNILSIIIGAGLTYSILMRRSNV